MPRDALASAEYYLANKERIKENNRLYYYHMTPECQARNRRYYSQHKDAIREKRGRTKRQPPKPKVPKEPKEPKPPKEKRQIVFAPPKRKIMEFPEASFNVSFA